MMTETAPDHLPTTLEHLRSPRTRAVLLLQNKIVDAARTFLTRNSVVEVRLPVIGPVTDPGARGAKQVDVDYYGRRYKLMTSAILYKQATLKVFDAIYTIAPNIRMEPLETATTHRHLAEFHQIDVEVAGASRAEAMRLAEGLVVHVVRECVSHCASELELLGRDTEALERACLRFGRTSHAEAAAALVSMGHPQDPGAELDWQGEELLSARAKMPFFVVDYPKGSRGFYDRESRTTPGVLRNFDLLAPEGYGELASGSERESDYVRLVTRMRETGENPAKYGWYLQLVRDGVPPSAGFGVGLERLTRYVAGLDAAWQASAYPKVPGVFAP
ncbi:MAG: Asparagine--tRNA ligase related protein [uncultured Pseudonocardia sp.]|uniref:Asparagine--tRNA ligase related protein n=1 Tax=uncultured Pseudonocardia sp. TaxID=211455 RepID=A0A6J4P190_9PSEU|nr:MAG: Asparagine--tRNA ligase related protein [uncultured Pseudonocardia sp.]